MPDDTVDIVVTVPRQVAEKAKAAHQGYSRAPSTYRKEAAVEAERGVYTLALDYSLRAALLETDLTPPPDPPTCEHLSATGVDEAPMGDAKVWRCDACGWLHQSVQVEAAGSMVRVLRAAAVRPSGETTAPDPEAER